MLHDFYEKHELPLGELTVENAHSHLALLMEEVGELAQAVNKRKGTKHIPEELADVLYVAVGMGVSLGVDLNDVFGRIHERNMTKQVSKLGAFTGDGNSSTPI
jgi:NTP pyrophosphatase (non-canonical NTP hydrolase)